MLGFPACSHHPGHLGLTSTAAKALADLETQPGDPFEGKSGASAAGTLARLIGAIQ